MRDQLPSELDSQRVCGMMFVEARKISGGTNHGYSEAVRICRFEPAFRGTGVDRSTALSWEHVGNILLPSCTRECGEMDSPTELIA